MCQYFLLLSVIANLNLDLYSSSNFLNVIVFFQNGTKLFLIFYIGLTIFSSIYSTISACVWTLLPLIVIPLTLYAFYTNQSKYLYPFLITTVGFIFKALKYPIKQKNC